MVQTIIAGSKALLYGLKDAELEQRIMKLEEKLEDGVVIPHHEKYKEKTVRPRR